MHCHSKLNSREIGLVEMVYSVVHQTNKNELRQQTPLTRIVFPPIGAWIHDGHGYIRWVEWGLRTELQNRPVNSLLSRQSIVGQIVAGTCIYICEALRDCFTFTSMLKASINSRQVSLNLLRLLLGRNVNGNAVKMLL